MLRWNQRLTLGHTSERNKNKCSTSQTKRQNEEENMVVVPSWSGDIFAQIKLFGGFSRWVKIWTQWTPVDPSPLGSTGYFPGIYSQKMYLFANLKYLKESVAWVSYSCIVGWCLQTSKSKSCTHKSGDKED